MIFLNSGEREEDMIRIIAVIYPTLAALKSKPEKKFQV